ncbi:MAG: Ni/Fe hydrogenase subunit alpha, partial [Candidatus Bathyarchaeia archaeon]
EKRNILGVIEKAGIQIAKEVIKHRAYGQKITEILGGKATHPVCGLPGGVSKPLSEENRQEIEKMAESTVNFAKLTLKIFHDMILGNSKYVELIKSETYTLRTYYMGLVDEHNKVNLYDGKIRVVDPYGNEFIKFEAKNYLEHIAEYVEPWTYVKQPYLKKVGWKGFIDGPNSGVYRVGPLARLNAADGMATPLAQEEYELMYNTLGGKPVHYTLAYHWARLIELLYAAERAVELVKDPEITSPNVRNKPGEPGEGVGVVEAARGTLIHHYVLDENALVKDVNLIVATVNNAPSINMSVRNAAKGLIHGGKVDQGILNMVEMAFRAYDPCLGCATHYAIGQMPLTIEIYDTKGRLIRTLQR